MTNRPHSSDRATNDRAPSDRAPSEEESRSFWESRGRGEHSSDLHVTLFAEHTAYLEYIHRSELRYLQPIVEQLGRPRVLDLGCGVGRLSLELAAKCSSIVATDVAESLLESARQSARRRAIRNVEFSARAFGEPIEGGPFDLVLVSGVLNCVDDSVLRPGLREVVANLRPGGLVYIRNNCANVSRTFRSETANNAPTVFRTADEYRALVSEHDDLRVLDDRFLFPPLCYPNLAYYHVLPRGVREAPPVRRALAAWFQVEEVTSDARLRLCGPLYPRLLRALGKPTALRILLARRFG
jgi:2-polyprenyl-3-methyl-5-hydroxy-6-metoxy-1,4-benzoquinol methylase